MAGQNLKTMVVASNYKRDPASERSWHVKHKVVGSPPSIVRTNNCKLDKLQAHHCKQCCIMTE